MLESIQKKAREFFSENEENETENSYSTLEINGYGVELNLGTIDNPEEFDTFDKGAQKDELIPWEMIDEYELQPNEYNDIINIWGIEGKNINNIDSVYIMDENDENKSELDKAKIELYCIEEPKLSKTSKSGYLGYADYEAGLSTQYMLDNRYFKNSDQINIILLSVSTEKVFSCGDFTPWGCKYVLVMSDDEKQEILKKYNYSQFSDLIFDLKNKFEEETEIVMELKKFILEELDFEQGSKESNSIYLFNKSGNCIYYADGNGNNQYISYIDHRNAVAFSTEGFAFANIEELLSKNDNKLSQEIIEVLNISIDNFINLVKEKFNNIIEDTIYIEVNGKLKEYNSDIDININVDDIEGIILYMIFTKEISANNIDSLFLDLDEYYFYAAFKNNSNIITQCYSHGEYDSGYFSNDQDDYYVNNFDNRFKKYSEVQKMINEE